MSFVYTPAFNETEFVNLVVKNVMDSLVGEYGEPVFRYFVEYVAKDAQMREELNRVLAGPSPAAVGAEHE